MKKTFNKPEMELITFEAEDIITTSGTCSPVCDTVCSEKCHNICGYDCTPN